MSKLFEAKIWMRCTPGENDYSMFINEQPEGGFEWSFKDYDPKDDVNFKSLVIHNFTIEDIEKIQEKLLRAEKMIKIQGEALEFYGDEKNQIAPIYKGDGREKPGADFTQPYRMDSGKRARQALKEVEEIINEN